MILNTTSKPFFKFSAMQRLATNGEIVTSQHIKTIDEFDTLYAQYANLVTRVIVDDTDFVLANDISNAVLCPVVTLSVEIMFDTHVGGSFWHFQTYNPDEK